MSGEEDNIDRPILIEESHFERKKAVRLGRFKLIETLNDQFIGCKFCGRIHGDRQELFDLVADPSESKNLATEHPGLTQRIRSSRVRFLSRS
jgi:arylsulfatase A-like enzyme